MKPPRPTYSLIDEMTASPTLPMKATDRVYQLTAMFQGLRAMELDAEPSKVDWRLCSDAVNLMETLVVMGEVEDASGLLADAVTALATAGQRSVAGGALRLDGPGIHAVRSVLENYASVIACLPARTMVRCHRATERHIRDILAGRASSRGVEIVNL